MPDVTRSTPEMGRSSIHNELPNGGQPMQPKPAKQGNSPPEVSPPSPRGASGQSLQSDQVIGDRYRILRHLGSGGFGQVYAAEDLEPADDNAEDTRVALKIPTLPQEKRVKDEQVQKYRDEAQILRELKHPNIVELLHFGGTGEIPFFLVTKYIEGQDLAQRVKSGLPITPTQAARWTAAIADALQHAHSQGILHLDVKPANILLDGAEKPYLVDFGLGLRDKDRLKRMNKVAGTYAYMSPEQASGKVVDASSDIFSLGATLYFLLTGRVPFGGNTRDEILENVRKLDPMSPRQIVPEVPERLEAICQTALVKRLSDRYPSAAEMAEALRQFLKPPRLDRSPLLKLMVDRRDQDDALREALKSHKKTCAQRPLLLLIHGRSDQAIHEYLDRVRRKTLPKLLKHLGLFDRPKWLNLNWARGVGVNTSREQLLRHFCADVEIKLDWPCDTWPASAAKVVAALRSPLVLCYRHSCKSWNAKTKTNLEAWTTIWRDVPDLLPSYPLLVFFVVEDDSPPATRRAKLRRAPAATETTRVLRKLEAGSDLKLPVTRFPELGNVTMRDIETWIYEHLRPTYPSEVLRHAREILDDPRLIDPGVPFDSILLKIKELIRHSKSSQA